MKIIKEKFFKILKRKNLFFCLNIKIIVLILINISLVFYLSKQNINKIRALNDDENDPRSKGPNENCMAIINNDLYTIFGVQGEVDLRLYTNISLSLCENIGNIKSSCILKKGTNTIRLAGDINGEKNNKNKLVINGTLIKIYLAAGDICKDQERYTVDLTIEALKYDDDNDNEGYQDNKNYIIHSESSCHYSFKINQYSALIYNNYYGLNLSMPFQIILGIGIVILGIVIKIFSLSLAKEACYITLFIGIYFLISIIIDLYMFDLFVIIMIGSLGSIIIFSCICASFEDDIKGDLPQYNAILGIFCGYPMIKMISLFTIIFFKISFQRLIHHIFLIGFSIGGGIIGAKYPDIYYYIGSNIFENYLIVKGLSYIFYKLVPPIDEKKIYDLGKTKNFEMIEEMINGLAFIYPILFIVMSLINKPLIDIICKVLNISKEYNKAKEKNNEYELSISKENEEKCIEAPYYETQN